MKWVLIGAAAVAGLIGLVVVIGALLPQSHVATVSRDYAAGPPVIWQTITDVEGFASWRSGLQSAERLPAQDGRLRWREKNKYDGMTIEVTESEPEKRLVTRIADEGLPFGGTWTYEIAPTATGSRLSITERGEVYNPFFRFVSRFVMGHEGTLNKFHEGLTRKLSQAAR
jgi:uncharacterized protein YndB with AHSA1/START domain